MMAPHLDARGVTVRIGSATLLDDVAIDAAPGELVAIIGPNGAGKSTLLRVLSGDITPTSGSVSLSGRPIGDLDTPTRASIRAVFMPTGDGRVPFSVWDVAMMGRHPHRRDPANSAAVDRHVVAASLDRMDVATLADRVVSTLSSGERTRVGLARVLAQAAPLLLLDEPTTALDIGHEIAVMRELRAEARAGKTVVAVLHDLNAASSFASRIVAMDRGRVVAEGSPDTVLDADLLSRIYRHSMAVITRPDGDGVLVVPNVDAGRR